MNDDAIDRAAALLLSARRDRRALDALPEDLRPADADTAYAIQDSHVAGLGGAVVGWKVGAGIEDWRGLDLAAMRTELLVNGEQVSDGSGANVLGHPLEPLVWLANARAARGGGLAAGEIVTTGSTCAALGFADAGDSAEARFAAIGSVSVSFR